jgi:hypothetical protein
MLTSRRWFEGIGILGLVEMVERLEMEGFEGRE